MALLERNDERGGAATLRFAESRCAAACGTAVLIVLSALDLKRNHRLERAVFLVKHAGECSLQVVFVICVLLLLVVQLLFPAVYSTEQQARIRSRV